MPYLTASQIEASMTALATGFQTICKKTPLPHQTLSEGILAQTPTISTTYSFLEIANGTGPDRVTALAVAGFHAREWAQPDAAISFAQKLVAAYRSNSAFVIPAYTEGGKTVGPFSCPAATIKRMVDNLNILILPLANPDGRAFSQSALGNIDWRKNRAPRPSPADPDEMCGVDINRNFDIAWDYDLYYTPAFVASGQLFSSKDPASILFIGKPKLAPNQRQPDQEPETKNLIWILDNRPVTFSFDLHSSLGKVMHPWGIERNGSKPAQNFRDQTLDGKRDGTLGDVYSEFIPNAPPARILDKHNYIATSMSDRIFAATGRRYGAGGIANSIYPATGTFTDYCFSRQFTIPGSKLIHAFVTEFGTHKDGWQPHPTKPDGYPKLEREIHAALLTFFESALGAVPLNWINP